VKEPLVVRLQEVGVPDADGLAVGPVGERSGAVRRGVQVPAFYDPWLPYRGYPLPGRG
jgi:hypothetical protein